MSQRPTVRFRVAVSILIVFAQVCAGWSPAEADSSSDRFLRIRRWVREGKSKKASRELLDWRQRKDPEFTRNNLDYLLGRLLEREGRRAEAAEAFEAVAARGSLLADHAVWHRAMVARAEGDRAAEKRWIRRLIDSFPRSLWRKPAVQRFAESAYEDRRWKDAINAFRDVAAVEPGLKRECALRIAECQMELGQTGEARVTLAKLLISDASDDIGLASARVLDRLDRQRSVEPAELDRIRRARVYQENRAFDEARVHLMWLAERARTTGSRSQALFDLGRGYYQQRKFDQAIECYDRAHALAPKEPQGEQAYYQAGHAHARAGRDVQAVDRYESFIKSYPTSEWLPGAHLNAIDALRTAGRPEEALAWCDRTWNRFPGQLAGVTAIFSKARIRLAAGEYETALRVFEQLSELNLTRIGPSAPSRPEVTFLRAVCLERLGRHEEAMNGYLALPDERDHYYGQRATGRLRALLSGEPASKLIRQRYEALQDQVAAAIRRRAYTQAKTLAHQAWRLVPGERQEKALRKQLEEIYGALPAYRRLRALSTHSWEREWAAGGSTAGSRQSFGDLAREFNFLGLYDEGAEALAAHLDPSTPGRRAGKRALTLSNALTLAVYAHRGGDAYRTLRIGERQFGGIIPRDIRLELLPPEVAHLLYPIAHPVELMSAASKAGVDPRFVLAIARQESRFHARAKSPAGARGLLQFIPETAAQMAGKLQVAGFTQELLYQPEVALQFGATYLRELIDRYKGNLQAAAAAYNGGEENVDRWLSRARTSDVDRFVSEIGYRETKDYVRHVLSNFQAYENLVDAKLKP
ncbi:MAG: transglycosylase SLT domain-containing protein [Acidobacteria bacterium]|nr:transglycosylase SLT domain-containing protein [Acidobacteriota bacterium]